MNDRLAEIYRELKRLFDDHRVIALSAAYTAGVLAFLFLIALACGGGSATARAEARRASATSRETPRMRAKPASRPRAEARRREDPASSRMGEREYEVDLRGQGAPPAPDPGAHPAGAPESFGAEPPPPHEDLESFEALPPAAEGFPAPPGAE
jgi:hypothetical protein